MRRTRLALLVLGPVVVFSILAFVSLWAIGTLALLSAMGHGSLTREEEWPMLVAGGVISLVGAFASVLFLERRVLGPKAARTDQDRDLGWRARGAALVLIVIIIVGGPPLAQELSIRWTENHAVSGDRDARWAAIRDLEVMAPSPRAFEILKRIAFDAADDPEHRAHAASALAAFPDAKPLLIQLSADPIAEVRAEAAAALTWRAEDAETWAVVERAARNDKSGKVRQRILATLSTREVPAARRDDRARLLKELSTSDIPDEVLSAAKGLGAEGLDAALAIIMDVNQLGGTRIEAISTLGELKNPRALELLRAIVEGRVEPGFIPPGREISFRAAAAGSIGKLATYEEYEWVRASFNEQSTLMEVEAVLKAQSAYRDATGFVDGRLACLEQPASCVPGRDRDELLLGASLVSLLPRRGYARQFHAGPSAPRDQVVAKKASITSATSFAYVAVPEVLFETGIRAFCGDDTGQICFTRDGKAPPLQDGRCPQSAPALTGSPYYTDSPTAPRECLVR